MPSSPEPAPRVPLRTRFASSLATLGAVATVGALAIALSSPSPPRHVSVSGGWEGDPTCHGPAVWTGEVAWIACDWFYRKRALVELDPEAARAKVLYRWSVDDGNTPELRIVRPCEDGHLFVIGETKQTTLVVQRAAASTGTALDVPGDHVLGAECQDGRVELFVGDGDGYSIRRVTDAKVERVPVPALTQLPGRVEGAWFEGGAWHAVIRASEDGAAMTGALGGSFARIGDLDDRLSGSSCLAGEPGGWLCVNRPFPLAALGRVDGAFRLRPFGGAADDVVIYPGPDLRLGFTRKGWETVSAFHGLGALDFELADRDSVFKATRLGRENVVVAKSSFSPLGIGALALPLKGERVAVWGGLGAELIVLGSDLRRLDGLGIVRRTLRPFGNFRSSSTSVFDQVCYFTLLAAACAWLLVLLLGVTGRWKLAEPRRRTAAVVFVALFCIGIWGFYNVAIWV